MKKVFYILLALASITSCKKDDGSSGGNNNSNNGLQITSDSVIASMSPGTVTSNYRVDSGIIAIPTSATNAFYNYPNISTNRSIRDSFLTPASVSAYSTATYMQGVNQSILNNNVSFNRFYRINATNWVELGSHLANNVNIPIPSVGSINIPSQSAVNNGAIINVNFPIQYGDTIAQTSSSVINTGITANYSGFTLNNEPFRITTTTVVASKNMAWGKMKINGYSDTLDVIVQRYTTTVTINFSFANSIYNSFLNSLLSSYGVSNNQQTTFTEYRYWAKNKGLVMVQQSNGSATVRTDL